MHRTKYDVEYDVGFLNTQGQVTGMQIAQTSKILHSSEISARPSCQYSLAYKTRFHLIFRFPA